MAACKDRVGAGSYAGASIVRSSVASDDEDSFGRPAASTAAAASVVTVEADSVFYAIESAVVEERSSADAVATETQIRCPGKVED